MPHPLIVRGLQIVAPIAVEYALEWLGTKLTSDDLRGAELLMPPESGKAALALGLASAGIPAVDVTSVMPPPVAALPKDAQDEQNLYYGMRAHVAGGGRLPEVAEAMDRIRSLEDWFARTRNVARTLRADGVATIATIPTSNEADKRSGRCYKLGSYRSTPDVFWWRGWVPDLNHFRKTYLREVTK